MELILDLLSDMLTGFHIIYRRTIGQDAVKCKGAVDGIEMLKGCDMMTCMFEGSTSMANQFNASLFDTFMSMQGTHDPLWINYCSSLLRLSLDDTQGQKRLWTYLLV